MSHSGSFGFMYIFLSSVALTLEKAIRHKGLIALLTYPNVTYTASQAQLNRNQLCRSTVITWPSVVPCGVLSC